MESNLNRIRPIKQDTKTVATYLLKEEPCRDPNCTECSIELETTPTLMQTIGVSVGELVAFRKIKYNILGARQKGSKIEIYGVKEGGRTAVLIGEYPDILGSLQVFQKETGPSQNSLVRGEAGPINAVSAVEYKKDGEEIVILDTQLKVNKRPAFPELVPNIKSFTHFTQDAPTLGTLAKIAGAAELKLPCLLEGETAASKTSSIEYVASLINQPVFRLNLNGQTDTSELIGKYVPNEGTLAIAFNELLRNSSTLKGESQQIVQKANHEGRGLSQLESQQIARNEGLEVPDWRWQDGIIPMAMKRGAWVILDEINLAEPQVLERLNSVLESNPTLTLSEHSGEKIGDKETPVSQEFRIFATMNPAEYSGRSPMSPAYKDRWISYRFCPTPEAKEYGQMFGLLIYGKQPSVQVEGVQYKSVDVEPKYPRLAEIKGMDEFFGRLAQFHAKITELARKREIGKDFKEPYIFTRRGLLALIAFLNDKRLLDRNAGTEESTFTDPKKLVLKAIREFYLDKMRSNQDRQKILDQLASVGLTEQNWGVQFVIPGRDVGFLDRIFGKRK